MKPMPLSMPPSSVATILPPMGIPVPSPVRLPKLKEWPADVKMVAIPEPDLNEVTVGDHTATRGSCLSTSIAGDAVGFIPRYITRLAPMNPSRTLLVARDAIASSDSTLITVTDAPSGCVRTQCIEPHFSKMDVHAFSAHQDDAYSNRPDGKIGKDGRRRLIWTSELHQRFVTSVRVLGIKSSVPKNVLQLMNVEGITRENVASRLQKFRIFVRRTVRLGDGVGLEDVHLSPAVEAAALDSPKLCV